MQCLSSCVCLISFDMMFPDPSIVLEMTGCHSFYGQVIFYCMYYFLYSFVND